MTLRIIEMTDSSGRLIAEDWLTRSEAVHRQLRPQLMPDYHAQMLRVFTTGGRMIVAVDGDTVAGLSVWRIVENTFARVELHIDDLVADVSHRSKGVGKGLLDWLEAKAREHGCTQMSLHSGTPRMRAHRFYFREGLQITSFHFVKPLS